MTKKPTVSAKYCLEDTGTGDGDDLSNHGSLPACYAVPFSFAPQFCGNQTWLDGYIFTQSYK